MKHDSSNLFSCAQQGVADDGDDDNTLMGKFLCVQINRRWGSEEFFFLSSFQHRISLQYTKSSFIFIEKFNQAQAEKWLK